MSEYKRVRYNKSPLVEVIFQLRFPTILSINAKQPAEFQEKIREQYPFYQEVIEQQNELVIAPDGAPSQFKRNEIKNYVFISSDNKYKINLTSSFISLSTVAYTQWEDYLNRVKQIIPLFEEIYAPSFYTRVGLRYIDVITKSNLGLIDKKWSELIRPHVLGILGTEIEDGARSYLSESEYANSDGKTFTKVHFELVHVNDSPETSFLIDTDYFISETVSKEDIITLSELLHFNSSNFIGSSITPVLSAAMEPVDL